MFPKIQATLACSLGFILLGNCLSALSLKDSQIKVAPARRIGAGCHVSRYDWIGNGRCDADGEYNTFECDWDGGVILQTILKHYKKP